MRCLLFAAELTIVKPNDMASKGVIVSRLQRLIKEFFLNFLFVSTEKNGLSFIETSALDSTNVEASFQHILSGKFEAFFIVCYQYSLLNILFKYSP